MVIRSPCVFYLREVRPRLHLIPTYETSCGWQIEVVAAPDDQVLADSPQFGKKVSTWRDVPIIYLPVVKHSSFQFPCAARGSSMLAYSIRRVGDAEVEIFIRQAPHEIYAIAVMHFTPGFHLRPPFVSCHAWPTHTCLAPHDAWAVLRECHHTARGHRGIGSFGQSHDAGCCDWPS